MFLIVGLGNPENDYANTRHNMGVNVINELSKKYNIDVNKSKFKGLFGNGVVNGEKVILLKPQTFMNLSGESVKEVMDFYKITSDEIIVIYDDIDLDPGVIRIRKSGGPGTHNGMKSVVHFVGNQDFARVRVGIGKPIEHENLIEYVIGAIPDSAKEELEKGVKLAADAVDVILKQNIDVAMNKFN